MIQKTNEPAVSPVVGVMLMLVVVIIIAAVVSAFAGGLTTKEQKAPQISAECKIINGGTWQNSMFDLAITGTSEPVPTRDVELITAWKAADGTKGGSRITGPNVSVGSFANTHFGTNNYHGPEGYGPGVNRSKLMEHYTDQMFGNYTLTVGTRMHSSPAGMSAGYGISPSTRFQYTNGGIYKYETDMDGMQAVLGREWYRLRTGDVVTVKLVHRPSGKVIFDQDVSVVS
ncbi:MAG: type IV pilin [Methanoregula sp.]|nr:type IV pilin [Methanoregula sp.]